MTTKTKAKKEIIICSNCSIRQAEPTGLRCGYCKKHFDSYGKPYLLSKDQYEFKSKLGLHYLFFFFENRCCHAPAGYEDLINASVNAVVASMEQQGCKLVTTHLAPLR